MATTRLKFEKPHRSITSLPDIELPAFAIITGINGSGKSHLLEAIENGSVSANDALPSKRQVRRYDWASFSPHIEEIANGLNVRQKREQALSNLLARKNALPGQFVQYFAQNRISGDNRIADPHFLITAAESEISDVLKKCSQRGQPMSNDRAKNYASAFLNNRKEQLV